MSLQVSQLVGFNANASNLLIEVSITSSENDVNLFTKAAAVGAAAANVMQGTANFYLANGVVLGSTSTSTPGVQSGSGWGTGWTIYIIVQGTDSARIQGKGGVGGNGEIEDSVGSGGAGGGGAGTQVGAGGEGDIILSVPDGDPGTATAGGAGSTGTTGGTIGFRAAGNGLAGGDALEATDGGPDIHLAPESGATLEVWGGGGGGGGGGSSAVGNGGNGGNPGVAGSNGTGGGPGTGGANGLAYSEPGSASIVEDGPGTIDDLGT